MGFSTTPNEKISRKLHWGEWEISPSPGHSNEKSMDLEYNPCLDESNMTVLFFLKKERSSCKCCVKPIMGIIEIKEKPPERGDVVM